MITEFADPPATKEPQPTISKGLQEALGEIEKGAQERMEALRAKKERLETGKSAEETVPKLIGHIEKVEEEEIEEGVEGSGVVQKKGDDGTRRKITKGATVGQKEGVQQPEEQAAGTKGSRK